MQKARIDKDGWVRCGNCGHKMFKTSDNKLPSGIEIKCHSCKKINTTDEVWIFTFGQSREVYGERANHFVRIAGTYSEARAEMVNRYGDRWAFQYSEREWRQMQEAPDRYWPMETEFVE